jgi:hypothetical protein
VNHLRITLLISSIPFHKNLGDTSTGHQQELISEASVNNISNSSSIDPTADNRTVDEFRNELLHSLQFRYNIIQSDITSIHIKDMGSCVDHLIS